MDAIKILEHEHEAILFGIALLEKATKQAVAGKAKAAADLAELVGFLKGFADACHHGKEEGILFPALEAAGLPREGGPIGAMIAEHERGRILIRGMTAALAAGDYSGAFAKNAAEYAELLRAHIEKENGVLFPMGARALGQAALATMGAEFDKFEETVMGKGEHERLHAMLEAFSRRYG